MNREYGNLFAAIYRQAVIDDHKEVCIGVMEELKSKRIDRHDIVDYLRENEEAIKDKVRENVYAEAQNWGNGFKTVKMNRNSINNIVREMVDEY